MLADKVPGTWPSRNVFTIIFVVLLGLALVESLNPSLALADATCPAGWTCADIGNPGQAGSASLNGTVWTVKGGGYDIWGTTDQFQYAWQPLTTDGTLSAHVTSQTNTSPYAKAGMMFRASTDPGAPFYLASITPTNGVIIQYRTAAGVMAANAILAGGATPLFLRISRTGTTFAAATSPDGATWTPVAGSSVTIPALGGGILAGLAVTAHNNAALSTATFDAVALTTPAPPPPTGCPAGWTCADVGNPGLAGSASLNGTTWTVSGGGYDIWGTTDQFEYAWRPLTTDGTLSARVLSQTNTNGFAKAGVMFRASTDPGAPYYLAAVSPANGILLQYRTATGVNAQESLKLPGTTPAYVRIARTGNSFTTLTSPDGATWTTVGGATVTIPALGGNILAGLAVTAHNNGALSTATFDAVALTTPTAPPPTGCPTGWTCADIGNPGQAGSASLNGTMWTVRGGGYDIWGTTDQFQYAWQPLTTDGTLSARVTSQTNPSPYAKAGVMFRASTDPGAPFYLASITPTNGVIVQYRTANGVMAANAILAGGATPLYLRISRTGTTFAAATSPDGATWTPVAGSSVAIPALGGGILAGLAVTAHNNAALSTATFDSLAITTGAASPPITSDWTQYLHDLAGSDYNSTETTLTSANIANLKVKWTATGQGGTSDQPIESNNVVYWGSWDGNLHATTVTGPNAGKDLWATNLGVTTDSSCVPAQAGVASTPALGTIGQTPVLFVGGGGNDAVGGGNVYVYAINATNGQIIWKTVVGSSPNDFAWSSPLLYNGSLFYGMASFGDCPLTRGRLVKLDQATGTVQGTFYTEPAGCTAGGIWGTPTIDTATGMLFTATGTQSYCQGQAGDYAASLLEVNTANLSYVTNWQLPLAQQISDADFGSAPTLFTATINGVNKQMVGIANKNGSFYAFDRTNIGAGPLWTQTVANAGECPQCGGGSISPPVWDGTTLYVAGGKVTLNGTTCSSSVNALNPATGAFLWQRCLQGGPVLGSLTAIPGVVVATEGSWIYALSMSTGVTLFSYQDTNSKAFYYGPATIANGYLFASGIDGVFLAFSLA